MDEKPVFTLRPQLAVAVIPTIVGALLVALWLGFSAGILFESITVGLMVGLVVVVIFVFFRIMNLRARSYNFFAKKAEFYEGFLNIMQRTVDYQKVTDVVLVKTIWDRLFGTGTIRLVTAGHEGVSSGYGVLFGAARYGGGIVIQYIDHPDDIFKKVQRLLHK